MIFTEQEKYEKCWSISNYRAECCGEYFISMFLQLFQNGVEEGTSLIDWGCGSGRASAKLCEAGFDVTMVDFAGNCLDKNIAEMAVDNPRLRFVQHDLVQPCDLTADYGFCTDVMEHIPTKDVNTVLKNITDSSEYTFFEISTIPEDGFSKHFPELGPLHLTTENLEQWTKRFNNLGVQVLLGEEREDLEFVACYVKQAA